MINSKSVINITDLRINYSYLCVMENITVSPTTTYQQAKNVYYDTDLMQDVIVSIDTTSAKTVRKFRKNISEFEFRKKLGKRFTTKILNETQLLVKRIG